MTISLVSTVNFTVLFTIILSSAPIVRGYACFLSPPSSIRTSSFILSSSAWIDAEITHYSTSQSSINTDHHLLTMRVSRGGSKIKGIKGSTISEINYQRTTTAGRKGQKRFTDPNKLFVGNLPFDVTAEELRAWFNDQGVGMHIKSCKLIQDWKTKGSKGYGFVQFMSPIYASSAMEIIKGRKIKGREVRLSQGRKKLPDAVVFVKKGPAVIQDEEDQVIAGAIGAEADRDFQDDDIVDEQDDEELFELDNDDDDDDDDDDVEEFEFDGDESDEETESGESEEEEGEETTPTNRAQRREAARAKKRRRKPAKGFGNL